ncbi:cytochrome P450 [Panaeolus papilionaceus]|nr:cytochrome P450 [Panaeolus papilionaceus]
MFSVMIPSVLAAILALGLIRLLVQFLRPSAGPFPPGPKPRFLIGNALDIPSTNSTRVYLEWTKKYNSNILHLSALGSRFFILDFLEDADELFENRAKLYSDRAAIPTMELWSRLGLQFRPLPIWRSMARTSSRSAPKFQALQSSSVLPNTDEEDRFDDHGKMLSISIPLITMFGYGVKTVDDPVIHAADQHMAIGGSVMGLGGSLANIFPPFKHVPWTWTQRMGKECRKMSEQMKRIPLEALLNSMTFRSLKRAVSQAKGTAVPSLVGNFTEKKQTVGASPEEEEIVLNVAHTVYGAASDTTISVTRTFFYLMVTHPAIQAKAHAELDRVLGRTPRLPIFDDRPALSYIEAIYREVLRYNPPAPLGVGHVAIQDDWYKGYFIPKDRFFDSEGKLDEDDRILAYGFGKRICVGKHVASATVWLMFASILACFNLHKKKDQHGNEIEINDEFIEE